MPGSLIPNIYSLGLEIDQIAFVDVFQVLPADDFAGAFPVVRP